MTKQLLRGPCRFRQVIQRRDDVLGERVGERIALVRIAHEADAARRKLRESICRRQHAHDRVRNRPVDLEGRINLCRETRQNAPPLPRESREMLALSAYVVTERSFGSTFGAAFASLRSNCAGPPDSIVAVVGLSVYPTARMVMS